MKILDLISENLDNEPVERLKKRAKPILDALGSGYTSYTHYNPDDNRVYYFEFEFKIDFTHAYFGIDNKKLYVYPTHITIYGGRLPYSKRLIFEKVIERFKKFNITLEINSSSLVYVTSADYMEPVKETSLEDSLNENVESGKDKKAKLIFQALKKGTITVDVDFMHTSNYNQTGKYTFKYDLGDLFISEQPDSSSKPIIIVPPVVSIHCEQDPDLNKNNALRIRIFKLLQNKFESFGVELKCKPLLFRKKHDKWEVINENTNKDKVTDRVRKIYKALQYGVIFDDVHYELPDEFKFSINGDAAIVDVNQKYVRFYKIENGQREYISITSAASFLDFFGKIRKKFEKFKIFLYRHEIPMEPKSNP